MNSWSIYLSSDKKRGKKEHITGEWVMEAENKIVDNDRVIVNETLEQAWKIDQFLSSSFKFSKLRIDT